MFKRPLHNIIAGMLRTADHGFFEQSKVYFGGGTAIVLTRGEYRLSQDVDFLSLDADGYNAVRDRILSGGGMHSLFPGTLPATELVKKREKLMQRLLVDGVVLRVEILKEGNLHALQGVSNTQLGVPVLSPTSLCASKLLANADRWLDKGTHFRDMIDLAAIIAADGSIPGTAWQAAYNAYGENYVNRGYEGAVHALTDIQVRHAAFEALDIDADWRKKITDALRI